MTLVELARKWFPRLQRGLNQDDLLTPERAEIELLNKQVAKVWLEYHDNELWAQRKLAAGLTLTPEALAYMENEINARRLQKAADDKLRAEVEAEREREKADLEQERAADGRQRDGAGTRDDRSGGAGESGSPSHGADGSVPDAAPADAPEAGGHADGASELA